MNLKVYDYVTPEPLPCACGCGRDPKVHTGHDPLPRNIPPKKQHLSVYVVLIPPFNIAGTITADRTEADLLAQAFGGTVETKEIQCT